MSARAGAAVVGALVVAGALAWVGASLLALPAQESAVASAIVGGRDAQRFDDALRLFQASAARSTASDAAFARRAHAEAALAKQTGSPALRSRAQTLLGVLITSDAARRQHGAGDLLAAAAAAFRTALQLVPDDEDAAADLELLLAAEQAKAQARSAGRQGRGAGHGHGHRASKGATASTNTQRGY